MGRDNRQPYPDSYYSPLVLLWNHIIDFGYWLILGVSVIAYLLECWFTAHKIFVPSLSVTGLQHVLGMNMNFGMLNAMPGSHGLMLIPDVLLSIFMWMVRLLCFSFLSVSVGHLLTNMLILGMFFLMAYWLSIKQYLLFKTWFFGSIGIMAGYFIIMHLVNFITRGHIYWLNYCTNDMTPLMGASVGVLAVVGFVMVLSVVSMIMTVEDARDHDMSLSLSDWLCLLPLIIGIAVVWNLGIGQESLNVMFLHWFGVIVGIIAGIIWFLRFGRDDEEDYSK